MKELLGQTIANIFVSKDDEVLAFVTNEGKVHAYCAYGDCCSSTWFDSIIGVQALIGQTVLTAEDMGDVHLGEERAKTRNDHYIEEMQNYGVKLTTAQGHIDIIYRNSSNGYYGGSADYTNSLLKETLAAPEYVEITDDWTA